MRTQAGVGLGLLFLAPLGDMIDRKKLVIGLELLLALALIGMSVSGNLTAVYVASFTIGIFAVAVQIVVPMAASMATPETKGEGRRNCLHKDLDRHSPVADRQRIYGRLARLALGLWFVGGVRTARHSAHPCRLSKPARQTQGQLPYGIDPLSVLPLCKVRWLSFLGHSSSAPSAHSGQP